MEKNDTQIVSFTPSREVFELLRKGDEELLEMYDGCMRGAFCDKLMEMSPGWKIDWSTLEGPWLFEKTYGGDVLVICLLSCRLCFRGGQ